MKKNRLFMMAGALCAALGLGSCSNEMDEVAVPAEGATRTVTLTVSLPDRGADTRTAYAADGAGLKVTWADGDELTAFGKDLAKSTTFTLSSGAGETTGTFTGELPENVVDGDFVQFYYPKFKTEVIDSKTHYIFPDYTAQDGTLAGLSKVDAFVIFAQYSDGKLSVNSSYTFRYPSFLHFAKDTKVASTGGTATFTISGALRGYDYSDDENIMGDIVVSGNVNSDGTLAADVYIAFEKYGNVTPTLTIAVGSEKNVYSLDKEFAPGTMYNISDMSKLTVAPQVGMVIGSDGMYYATASDVPSGVKAEAMIAYLGTEAEGATHGLAIALEDASSKVTWDNSGSNNGGKTAAELVADWATYNAVTGGTWRLPSADDWKYMFQGCGGDTYKEDLTDRMEFSYGDFRTKLIAAGGESADVQSVYYWSATEFGSGSGIAWSYYFYNGKFETASKSSHIYVRAALAF